MLVRCCSGASVFMRYDLVQTVAPVAAAVSAADLRAHLRLDSTDQDSYLEALVAAATRSLEHDADTQVITATWQVHLADWWPDYLELPRGPLQSITSVTYKDDQGDTQTLAASNYDVVTAADVGRIHTADGATLPTLADVPQAVTITMVCGYGDAGTNVPAEVLHFIKLLAAHFYAHAEPVTVMGPEPKHVPETLQRLLGGITRRGAL